MKVITRYAPSPTGFLHIGHARAAVVNWLYSRKAGGEFILRFDDTDVDRSKDEYKNAIESDLRWLGLNWDRSFAQSDRLAVYQKVKEQLLSTGKLYQCFETEEELGYKRKLQLASGKPPIYDRAALKLSKEQIKNYIDSGRVPHYRFLLDNKVVSWNDMIKGQIQYDCASLSDPVVIRQNGTMTYMLCSVIDDIDCNISDIIRGEDHITNTAVQIQMFETLKASHIPNFAHFSLIQAKDEKISKRTGGFTLQSLKSDFGLEPMAINSFFALIGTSNQVAPFKNLDTLNQVFDIKAFSKSPITYSEEELIRLNHKLIMHLDFVEIKDKLDDAIDEKFWLTIRPNIQKLSEANDWYKIYYNPIKSVATLDKEFLRTAAESLPEVIEKGSFDEWIKKIEVLTHKKGKELFQPLRLALTGMEHGPELRNVVLLLPRDEILKRLKY